MRSVNDWGFVNSSPSMKLNIISLKGIEFEGEAVSINMKTTSGEITVLDNHRPLITALTVGRVSITKNDGEKLVFNIQSGFFEMEKGSRANILIR